MGRIIPTKIFTVDFYQVATERPDSFPGILSTLEKLPEKGEDRVVIFEDSPVRLRALKNWGTHWEGDFLRIRLNEPAFKARLSGPVEPVPMDDEQGLSESSAFLYFEEVNALVIQRNRSGVSASKMACFFRAKGFPVGDIELLPFIDPAALERLARMGSVRTFQIKLAKCGKIPSSIAGQHGVAAGIAMAKLFEAPSMDLNLSMGREKGSLSIGQVIDASRRLLGLHDAHQLQIDKLHVVGNNDSGDREPLDLLEQRIVALAAVKRVAAVEQFFRNRVTALQEAWQANRGKLSSARA